MELPGLAGREPLQRVPPIRKPCGSLTTSFGRAGTTSTMRRWSAEWPFP